MPWEILEVGEHVGRGGVITLTDDELISLYILLAYSSSSTHKVIANKLRPVAEVAKHNRHIHHSWENEGGAIINGGENGTNSSSSQSNT